MADHLQQLRDDGKVQPRRALDRTAWLTGIPLVALVIAEFYTILDKRIGGTVSETVWWSLGGREHVWHWALSGLVVGFLGWLAWHFTVDPSCGWRPLVVLAFGCAIIGVALWAVR